MQQACSKEVNLAAVQLCAPRSCDVGTCVARLPQGANIPAGTPLLLEAHDRAFLCLSLPLESSPSRKGSGKALRGITSKPAETGRTIVPARVDKTLAFLKEIGSESHRGLLPDDVALCQPFNPKLQSAITQSRNSARKDRAESTLQSLSCWKPAECIFVQPTTASSTQCDPAQILAQAKKALRCASCIPNPELSPNLCLSSVLSLLGADSLSPIAQISAKPPGPVVIVPETKILLVTKPQPVPSSVESRSEVQHVNHMVRRDTSPAYRAVCELLEQDVRCFWDMGAAPMKGLLLNGPPGVGKTVGVFCAARDCGFNLVSVDRDRNRSYGAPARALRSAFAEAQESGSRGVRSVIFLDELDALCPKRALGGTGVSGGTAEENRTVAQLLTLMDGGHRHSCTNINEFIYVVAATNRPNAIDPALRRSGRFDRELSLQAPTVGEREKILHALDSSLDKGDAQHLSASTAGFVASDLVQLRDEAKKLLEKATWDQASTTFHDISHGNQVSFYHRALRFVRPSLLRGSLSAEVPQTDWDDVGGMDSVKRRLRMAVEWPLQYQCTFKRLGLSGPRGVLLHGPPGCSKTTLVRAMATSAKANFLHISGADLYSCYLGEAERLLREAFTTARSTAPSIFFLDELDALVGKRGMSSSSGDGNEVQSRVLSTLLTEMDGLSACTGVLVVGATNRIDLLDDALLRPGRFDEKILVDKLSESGRLEVLEIHTRSLPLAADIDMSAIARTIPSATGAQVRAICQEAALFAVRSRAKSAESFLAESASSVFVGSEDFRAAVCSVLGTERQ